MASEKAYNLVRAEFNGVVGRGAPHHTALNHMSLNTTKTTPHRTIVKLTAG